MTWRTSISNHRNGEVYIRGKKLSSLVGKNVFVDGIFLLWRGSLPKKNEQKMAEALLLSCIEHGVAAPSAFIPRTVAGTGNSVNSALAAGVLSLGDYHGGAIEQSAKIFQSGKTAGEIVEDAIEKGERLPGYGHKMYKDKDPRAEALLSLSRKLKISKKAAKLLVGIKDELKKRTGKDLPINIDGAIAAIITDLGFDWRYGKAFFILGRLPGMAAHVHEELAREKPYRRLSEKDIEYDGA